MSEEHHKQSTVTDEQATGQPASTAGKKRHRVTFLPLNVTVEVDENDYPYGDHGLPGSILDIALKHDIRLEHNCGGNCACTTCHVIVKEGMDHLSQMQPDEEDRLDMAEGLTLTSRLGCQAVVRGNVVVQIPE